MEFALGQRAAVFFRDARGMARKESGSTSRRDNAGIERHDPLWGTTATLVWKPGLSSRHGSGAGRSSSYGRLPIHRLEYCHQSAGGMIDLFVSPTEVRRAQASLADTSHSSLAGPRSKADAVLARGCAARMPADDHLKANTLFTSTGSTSTARRITAHARNDAAYGLSMMVAQTGRRNPGIDASGCAIYSETQPLTLARVNPWTPSDIYHRRDPEHRIRRCGCHLSPRQSANSTTGFTRRNPGWPRSRPHCDTPLPREARP